MDDRIVAEAARWHARLAADDCTDFDRAEFERWRVRDRRRAEAYAAAAMLSAQVTHLARLDDRLRSLADEAFAIGSADEPRANSHDAGVARIPPGRRRRWRLPAALAAATLVALIGVQLSAYLTRAVPGVTYASSEQERREITLADGSAVQLDVASEISVSYSADERRIVLVNGRALFNVAHDVARPFVVTAGQSRTTALGTHFQVQREGQHVLVTLTEGSVAVTSDAERSHWRETLTPGEQISVTTDGQVRLKRAVDAQVVTSWSRGRLVFRGTPLVEALQEVNRYGSRKVRLGDPELADLTVGGNFIAGETELIVSAFAAVLPLRVSEDAAGEIILFRRYSADGG
jgi:transmembrane sensor